MKSCCCRRIVSNSGPWTRDRRALAAEPAVMDGREKLRSALTIKALAAEPAVMDGREKLRSALTIKKGFGSKAGGHGDGREKLNHRWLWRRGHWCMRRLGRVPKGAVCGTGGPKGRAGSRYRAEKAGSRHCAEKAGSRLCRGRRSRRGRTRSKPEGGPAR